MKFWWQNWVSSSTEELAEIQLRFDSYKCVHGDLFEDTFKSLTEEDTQETLLRRARFSKIFLIVYGLGMACVVLAIIIKTPKTSDYFYIMMLIGAPLIFRMMMMNKFNYALKSGKKRVIHGVITSKQMKRSGKRGGCYVEFSKRLTIQILPDDYKMLSLGNIVRMEMLSDDIYIKRKVVVEGSI